MVDSKATVELGDKASIKTGRGYPGPDDVLQILREFDDAACQLRETELEAIAANDKWLEAQEKYLELLGKLRVVVKEPEPAYSYKIIGVHNAPKE